MNKRIVTSLAVGAAISAAALYWAFRQVPLAELGRYLVSINYLWAGPALLLVLASLGLRAVRWRYLLAPVRPVPAGRLFHPMMVGFMLNGVLPGRLGEVARPLALRQTEGIAFGSGLATVAAERVFDLFVTLSAFLLVLGGIQLDPALSIEFGGYRINLALMEAFFVRMSTAGLVIVAGFALLSIRATRGWLIAAIHALPRPLGLFSPRLAQKAERVLSRPLARLAETAAAGLALLRSPRQIAGCALLTAGIWLLQLLSYVVLSWGAPGIRLGLLEMGATMIIIMFCIAMPSVPGWWGLWEAGGVFALTLFGVPRLEAAGFSLANHVLQLVPVILVGILSAAVVGLDIGEIASTGMEALRGGDAEPAVDRRSNPDGN